METTVPFYCPMCSGEHAVLLLDAVMATPSEPTLQCVKCRQLWRLNLYAVESRWFDCQSQNNDETAE